MNVPKGDYGYYLNFIVQKSDGTAYDLTGYTITLKVWRAGSPDILIMSGACDIVTAASGICKYLVASGDFDDLGRYEAELELTKVDVKESTKTFEIIMKESG